MRVSCCTWSRKRLGIVFLRRTLRWVLGRRPRNPLLVRNVLLLICHLWQHWLVGSKPLLDVVRWLHRSLGRSMRLAELGGLVRWGCHVAWHVTCVRLYRPLTGICCTLKIREIIEVLKVFSDVGNSTCSKLNNREVFQLSVAKPNCWANPCNRLQVRENMCKQGTIGFGFASAGMVEKVARVC